MLAPLSWRFGLAALLGFATVASSIGLIATSAYLISAAARMPSIAALQVAIVGVRFFGISRGLLRYAERYTAHAATFRLIARLRAWFYRAVEPLAPAGLQSFHSGDLLAHAVGDIGTLEQFYLRAVAPPLVALLTSGLAALLLGWFSPGLAASLLLALALGGVGLPLLALRLSRKPGDQIVAARAELSAALVGGVQGAADLLAFGAGARFVAELARVGARMARSQERLAAARGMHAALIGLLASWAGLAALALAIPLVREGQIDGVYLALIGLAATGTFEALVPLGPAAEHLSASAAAARRLFAIADQPPPVRDPAEPSPTPLHAGIELRGVCFSYPGSATPALDRVSLAVPPGGRLAIVGPSGAGKSTLVRLLLRFWEYEGGQIWLGGHELRRYRADAARAMISVVSQHTHLFNGSIRENLLLARPSASQAELEAAAKQAQLRALIDRLPRGYDTWIGEQGLRLSGGERQRLAVARAILQDAPILILDEPSAQLDADTERELFAALEPLIARRTTILITHRAAGLFAMDAILRIEGGRVRLPATSYSGAIPSVS